jgi:chloramphenicol O-acetyltransferase
MKRRWKWMREGVIILLILSLGINGFLFLNGKSKQKELESAILMNEFVDREKELRIFKAFIYEIANNGDVFPYYNEEQSDLYWILEQPYYNVMPKVTHDIRNAELELYNTYSVFLSNLIQRVTES